MNPKLKITLAVFFWLTLVFALFFSGYKISTGEWKIADFKQIFSKPETQPPVAQENIPAKKEEKEIPPPAIPEDSGFKASTWFSDYKALKANIEYYHEVHPFIYTMKGGLHNDGQLISLWNKEARKARVEEMRALNPKVKIIPTIFRWENPKEKIQENIGMNGRNDIRDKHIQIIMDEVLTYGYDGIDIDYEGMTCNKKEKFEEFIVLLKKELKKHGKLLSVALHPKTPASKSKMVHCRGLKKPIKQDFAENWRGPMTHDYEFLGKYADKVKIMAYELHPRKYHNPGPGPQAPNVWLKSIIEYASTRVPTEKLYMAIPTYGYDWALNCKARAKAVYYDTALKIQAGPHVQYQPTDIKKILSLQKNSSSWKNLTKFNYIHENKVYEDPSLWYKSGGCDRVAFYMNKKAFGEKMNLLRKYNLAGFSFWQLLSNNDPGINDYLKLLMTGKLPPVKTIEEEKKEKEKIELSKLPNNPENGTNNSEEKKEEIDPNSQENKDVPPPIDPSEN